MSRPVVVLPDVEAALKTLLTNLLAERDEPVVAGCRVEVQAKPDGKPLIQVERVSGSIGTPAHDNPTVDFRVWHTSQFKAVELARIASAELRSAEGAVAGEARVTFADELSGPTRTIDPVDGKTPLAFFRHQFFIR